MGIEFYQVAFLYLFWRLCVFFYILLLLCITITDFLRQSCRSTPVKTLLGNDLQRLPVVIRDSLCLASLSSGVGL
jgi:hypothetical protein